MSRALVGAPGLDRRALARSRAARRRRRRLLGRGRARCRCARRRRDDRRPGAPGLVDAHSHAFQRAFAGLAERRDSAHDDFWSWRDRMYGVALRITPEQLRAIAAHLYLELLARRLHPGLRVPLPAARPRRQPLRRPGGDVARARRCGRGGRHRPDAAAGAVRTRRLHGAGAAPDQRRFATSVADVLALQRAARRSARQRRRRRPLAARGAARGDPRAGREAAAGRCTSTSPSRPPRSTTASPRPAAGRSSGSRAMRRWISRWQLVHATHSVPAEIDAVAARGAGVVLCPGTEGNLGDGLADLPGWLAAGVPLALGSDSQVTRAWPEELRWLEYGQRLGLRRRNVSAAPGAEPSTAARLFERVSAGGAAAAGFARWGLQAGARADLLVARPARPGAARPAGRSPARRRRLRRAGASLRARDGRRPLAPAARRRHRGALRRRDAGAVGARRHTMM